MFFDITSDMVSTTIYYVKGLIGDLSPLWIIIISVGLGLIIFEVVVGTIRGRH